MNRVEWIVAGALSGFFVAGVGGCSASADPAETPPSEATGQDEQAFSLCTWFPFLCPTDGGAPDAGNKDAAAGDAAASTDAATGDATARTDAATGDAAADAWTPGDAGKADAWTPVDAGKADGSSGASTALRCFCGNSYQDLPCGNTDCTSGAALVAACGSFCGSNPLSAAACIPDAGVCLTGTSPPNQSKPEPNLVACDCVQGSISICYGSLPGTNCEDSNRSAVLAPICATECASLGGLAAPTPGSVTTSCVINDSTCVFAPQ